MHHSVTHLSFQLLQPRYATYLDRAQRIEIREKVQQIIDLLGSPEVAIDDHHSPKLYSRFLAGLLAKPATKLDRSPSSTQPLKSKSESPTTQKIELQDAAGTVVRQSRSSPPSTRPSMSPEPDVTLLDSYRASNFSTESSDFGTAMDVSSEFFAPPLPFNDLLPPMSDPSMTAMNGVPGKPSSLNLYTSRRLMLCRRFRLDVLATK